MKSLLFLASFFCFSNSYAQDSVKIKQIDSLVSIILHTTNLYTQRDSTVQDYPGIGLHMKTYITVMRYDKEVKKYSQIVKTTRQENQITKQGVSGTAFYYDQNKLIKVEEFAMQDDKENKMTWYFEGDKCFFHSLQSDKAEDRVSLLLNLSHSILKQIAGSN